LRNECSSRSTNRGAVPVTLTLIGQEGHEMPNHDGRGESEFPCRDQLGTCSFDGSEVIGRGLRIRNHEKRPDCVACGAVSG
jgi:hypothetical protein